MTDGYEAFFGLDERPFSLTSDARYFFPGSSHAAIRDRVTAAVRAHERFQLVTGDLGIGKTLLCHILVSDLRLEMPVAYVANPLITISAFDRLVTQEFGQPSIAQVENMEAPAVVVIDEAQTMTPLLLERMLSLSQHSAAGEHVFRFVFLAQSADGDPDRIGLTEISNRTNSRLRLLPLGRDECAQYVEHRLRIAGSGHKARFSSRAHDYVFTLSGACPES